MAGKRKKRIALVFCHGGDRAKAKVSRESIVCDCKQAVAEYPDGILECAWGCLGLGSCVSVCRFEAIVMGEHGTPVVDREKCIGCGLCAKTCPKGLIHMILPEDTIMPRCSNLDKAGAAKNSCDVSCIACRLCAKSCPTDAIRMEENHAVIDEETCVACGMCATKCPRAVISDAYGLVAAP